MIEKAQWKLLRAFEIVVCVLTLILMYAVSSAGDHTITLNTEQENALAYDVEQENHRRGDPDVGVNADTMTQIIVDAHLANTSRNMNTILVTPVLITNSPALTDRAQQVQPGQIAAPKSQATPTPQQKKGK